jgi:ParB-like nuclease domain
MTAQWPVERVERRAIDSLFPYARNARTHTDEQVAQIAASIQEWGWTMPVLIDDAGQIIAGHGRVLAARQLGISDVPVMIARGWTDAQKQAYVIADNKLTLNSGWNEKLLRLEAAELKSLGFDMKLVGFSELELGTLFGTAVDASGEWIGMPDYQQHDKMAWRTIIVHFNDQQAVEDFARIIGQNISEKTRYVWHPKAERDRLADQHYVAAE